MPIGGPCECPWCADNGGCEKPSHSVKLASTGELVSLCRRCGPAWCGRPLNDYELEKPPAGALHRIEEERKRAEKERAAEELREHHNIVMVPRLWYALVLEAGGPRKVSALLEMIVEDYFSRRADQYARIARKRP
jgi:hypothetical protein